MLQRDHKASVECGKSIGKGWGAGSSTAVQNTPDDELRKVRLQKLVAAPEPYFEKTLKRTRRTKYG